MRTRTAISLRNNTMDMEDFNKAFFSVFETDAAYFNPESQSWQRSPDKKSLVREDGSYISTVGRHYSIVDNRQYFDEVINALQEGGVDYIPKQFHVEGNGKRTTMIVRLPQFQMHHKTIEEQDFELRIVNSFDTTLAAKTEIGLLRLICTNGMTAFDQEFNYRMLHKGDITAKAKEAIELYQGFDSVFRRTQEQIERLGNSIANKAAVARYIGDGEVTRNNIFKGERWAKKLQEAWLEQNETANLWELYNIFTYIISHGYGSNYGSKMQKMNELNKEVKLWPRLLEVSTTEPIMYLN